MSNARVTLVNITDRVLNTYNTNEGWVVKKLIKLLPFCQLFIKRIRCNILVINILWWSLEQIMEKLLIGL